MVGTGDDIFLLQSDRKLVLRISGPAETEENLRFQSDVLNHLAKANLHFATPAVLPSLNGKLTEVTDELGSSQFVQLFTYVPGIPISSIPASKVLLRDVGRSLAALNLALAGISRPPPQQNLIWSVQNALDLLPMTEALSNPRTRALVMVAFDNFKQRTFPVINSLRHQIIHNDFNATNVLVSSRNSDHVSGVIDFGDLTAGPLVNDLAVAASRHSSPDDPLPDISAVCSGYLSATRLRPEEANALFDLICLRFAMRLAIWARKAAASGAELSPEIEDPEVKALSVLLGSDARQRISCLATA